MARCDAIPIHRLVAGWLDQLEVECLTELADARAFLRLEDSAYCINRVRYADYKLAAIRQVRQRIPNAWKKRNVLED